MQLVRDDMNKHRHVCTRMDQQPTKPEAPQTLQEGNSIVFHLITYQVSLLHKSKILESQRLSWDPANTYSAEASPLLERRKLTYKSLRGW